MRRVVTVVITALALIAPAAPAAAATTTTEVAYREQAVIAADQARIWNLLVDLPGYSSWNPWIVRAEGDATPGSLVKVDVVIGQHVMAAQHTVLVVEPQTTFCWKDSGWNALFVHGQRCRTLQRRADGTVLFTNELVLSGILSPAADLTIGKAMRDGIKAETAALKRAAEGPAT